MQAPFDLQKLVEHYEQAVQAGDPTAVAGAEAAVLRAGDAEAALVQLQVAEALAIHSSPKK